MALSVAPHFAWDFTHATNPLIDRVGGVEAFVLANGATVDTVKGIACETQSDIATLTCTNGGHLTDWVYPYTYFAVLTVPRTGGATANQHLFARRASGGTMQLGSVCTPSNGIAHVTNNGYTASSAVTIPATETLLTITYRATGLQVWFGTSSQFSNTAQTLSMPTLSDTDYIRFGANGLVDPDFLCKGFALIPGELTGGDRTALVADWRDALFGVPVGPTAAAIDVYRRRCGLI